MEPNGKFFTGSVYHLKEAVQIFLAVAQGFSPAKNIIFRILFAIQDKDMDFISLSKSKLCALALPKKFRK